MALDYTKLLGGLKDSIIDVVKGDANEFLEAHQDAKAFLIDRARRVAELGVEYAQATDEAGREAVKLQMEVVRQSVRNELASVAVGAEAQSKATFGRILETALSAVMKALPAILAAI